MKYRRRYGWKNIGDSSNALLCLEFPYQVWAFSTTGTFASMIHAADPSRDRKGLPFHGLVGDCNGSVRWRLCKNSLQRGLPSNSRSFRRGLSGEIRRRVHAAMRLVRPSFSQPLTLRRLSTWPSLSIPASLGGPEARRHQWIKIVVWVSMSP